MKSKSIKFFCTGFYSGCSPVAPGTAGSLAYLLLWYFIFSQNFLIEITALIFVTLGGFFATKSFLQTTNDKDPSCVVIDEWAGLAIALLLANPEQLSSVAIAFIAFRIFDAAKPWPVSKMEQLPGATGVMADDLLAGLLALILTFLSGALI